MVFGLAQSFGLQSYHHEEFVDLKCFSHLTSELIISIFKSNMIGVFDSFACFLIAYMFVFSPLLSFDRQSIDILSSVQSPNLSFLGTPTLSRLSNSFLAITDSFRSKAPETISSFIKPLLGPTPSDEQQRQHEGTRKSSEYLVPSRRSSLQQIPEDQKPPVGGHGASHDQNCSYTQGVMNGKHSTAQLIYYSVMFTNVSRRFTEMADTCKPIKRSNCRIFSWYAVGECPLY
jgi:hypothetical protein